MRLIYGRLSSVPRPRTPLTLMVAPAHAAVPSLGQHQHILRDGVGGEPHDTERHRAPYSGTRGVIWGIRAHHVWYGRLACLGHTEMTACVVPA